MLLLIKKIANFIYKSCEGIAKAEERMYDGYWKDRNESK